MNDVYLIVLKINDVNVSLLPYDEAVQMFLNTSDPIFLEVCRRRDFSFNQNDNNDCNITSNSQNELETETTFKQGHHLHYVDDKLVLSPTTLETTHTPTENYKATVCGSNAAHDNSSPQKHPLMTKALATTNTVKKQNLALYFPPPPPMLQQPIETDAENCNWAGLVSSVKNIDLNTATTQKSKPDYVVSSLQTRILEGKNVSASPKLISTAVQTDDSDFVPSLFHVTDTASTEAIIEREHNLFEASLAPEIDIEEITLRKSDSNEHLGLTVFYSVSGSSVGNYNDSILNRVAAASEDNTECAEIYISNIQPDSIAGRDGRLRQGDQILQVNGKDVTSKKETETLIAENSNAVTLLVSRYLYADEDDFNGTCVSGLDVDDDEDEDDDDEYYDDNNMTYENCFITSSNCLTEPEARLNRELIGTVTTTQAPSTFSNVCDTVKLKTIAESDKSMVPVIPVSISTTKPSAASSKKLKSSSRSQLLMKYDPFQHQSIKAHLKQANQELTMLDYRVQNMMVNKVGTALSAINYDTEHIYETIPEDSESEPFYCSPYENAVVHPGSLNQTECSSSDTVHMQDQKQRVAAWLRMQHTQRQHIANINNRNNTMLHYPQVISTWETSSVGSMVTSLRSGTVKSAATTANASTIGSCSSGGRNICLNEHDNSSSAYNTGSNDSGTALTLLINSPHMRNIKQSDIEPLAAMRITKSQSVHSPKDKLTSPKHQSATTASLIKMPVPNETPGVHCDDHVSKLPLQQAAIVSGIQQQLSTSTMYTNMANLQQTMLLQQQLFRNALMQQQQQKHFKFHLHQKSQTPPHEQSINAQSCAQFTTPNLSQYHFVSSQEVSAKQMRAAVVPNAEKNPKTEEAMVWKVKRRQDGTRYIVRRPARNRILRDRTLGINAMRENQDLTTTEGGTLSEVKTGRYWAREERKKNIERAGERRHHQQQLATTAAMRICDEAAIHSGTKCQTQTSKERLTKFINTTTLANQPLQNSHKMQLQSSSKLQHHKLQFGSMATSPTEISKQKQVPLAMTTTVTTGSTMTTNIIATAADSSVDVVINPRPDTSTANSLPKLDNNVAGGTGSAASTIMPQPQTSTTNEHKLVGLLSVTTV